MLEVNMEFKRGILFVRLKGILNGDTCANLKQELNELITVNGIKYVLLNLSGLEELDKYGLDTIKANYNCISKNQGKLLLCGAKRIPYNENIKNIYHIREEGSAFNLIHI